MKFSTSLHRPTKAEHSIHQPTPPHHCSLSREHKFQADVFSGFLETGDRKACGSHKRKSVLLPQAYIPDNCFK